MYNRKSAFRLDAEILIRFMCFLLMFFRDPRRTVCNSVDSAAGNGFHTHARNMRALNTISENVHAAAERFLGNFGP
jgi:hypothetical protein